jgi:hypothetical protein
MALRRRLPDSQKSCRKNKLRHLRPIEPRRRLRFSFRLDHRLRHSSTRSLSISGQSAHCYRCTGDHPDRARPGHLPSARFHQNTILPPLFTKFSSNMAVRFTPATGLAAADTRHRPRFTCARRRRRETNVGKRSMARPPNRKSRGRLAIGGHDATGNECSGNQIDTVAKLCGCARRT